VIMLVLAFAGGVLTILSPCILPVLPLVFARTGRNFRREVLPMLVGVALAFTGAALVATATARWLLVANEVGRYAALVLLGFVGLTLISAHVAEWFTQPATRAGAALLGGPASNAAATPLRNVVVGMAIGLLWAPCAGPILGLLIAAAATTAAPRAGLLFLTFALGAVVSLAVVTSLGTRLIARLKRAGAADVLVRRTLGLATLVTVIAIFFGWDQALFASGGLVRTASAEERLVSRFAPNAAASHPGESLDAFAAAEEARAIHAGLDTVAGTVPSLAGGTEWINSAELTTASLKGKVVLVDFWTFACYNCLNALPHVKALYAKYKDQGFVVVGVHTPELAHERIPENVRSEVKRLGIMYPVVIDNNKRIWNAFRNQYWPAAYFVDATGKMRFYHFGEGRYEEQDQVVAKLIAERDASTTRGDH
jgi:cytochrome c biogenesis protein CcdA/thiol-disulfide isomerase/thioredoxin